MDDEDMRNPFEFPFAGKMMTQKQPLGLAYGFELDLLNIPTGQKGVVRRLEVIMDDLSMTPGFIEHAPTVMLNICYDGELTPSVSVPYFSLCGYENTDELVGEWKAENPTANLAYPASAFVFQYKKFETPFWVLHNPITFEEADEIGMTLKYQIPYNNGIRIYLTTTDTEWTNEVWCTAYYQDDLPACWNKDYRFMAERSNESTPATSNRPGTISLTQGSMTVVGTGTNFTSADVGKYLVFGINDMLIKSVEDSTHLTVSDNDYTFNAYDSTYKIQDGHIWLERPAGKVGYLASAVACFSSYNLEANPRVNLNPSNDFDNINMTGGEDFFYCAFYATKTKSQSSIGGIVAYGTRWTGYVTFHDMPLKYTNGIKGSFPNVSGSNVQNNWTAVYYEKILI